MALEAASDPSINEMAAQADLVVDTYFHVIQRGTTLAQGNVPESQLASQVCDLSFPQDKGFILLTFCKINSLEL